MKAFITHGGMLSLQEAAYNGVPIIGIPFCGDQHFNLRHVESAGHGVVLDFKELTKKSLLEAMTKVITDSR